MDKPNVAREAKMNRRCALACEHRGGMNVGIYVFDEVEVLDACGPFEVFSTATRMKARENKNAANAFEVFMVADRIRTIRARGGLQIVPNFDFSNHPKIDLLLAPGGIVMAELERNEVIAWITRTAQSAEVVASVCTGAFLLAKAGLLDGKRATTHWEDLDDLRKMFPTVKAEAEERWIDEGRVVSSAGISAGLDMSLYLVGRIEGEELAVRTARQMDYRWQRE
jgi:transcriptional regulator GlxA family with amidase domain